MNIHITIIMNHSQKEKISPGPSKVEHAILFSALIYISAEEASLPLFPFYLVANPLMIMIPSGN